MSISSSQRPRPASVDPVSWTTFVPLRCGVRLATTVQLRQASFRGPALLLRTPYGAGNFACDSLGLDVADALARGYAVVTQDVRGRGRSEGSFGFIGQERDDGVDTLDWLSAQPWCDGRVMTLGCSYPGRAQLLLPDRHPALLAIAPAMAGLTSRETWWADGLLDVRLASRWVRLLSREGASLDPLRPYFTDHSDPAASIAAAPTLPSLHITGWFDVMKSATIAAWRATKAADGEHLLVVGPWSHDRQGDTLAGRRYPGGSADDVDLSALQLDFFDRQLRGCAETSAPRALVYISGRDRWQTHASWPPPTQIVARRLRLVPEGRADAAAAPAFPVAALDGTAPTELSAALGDGPHTLFELPPIDRPTELAGRPRLRLRLDGAGTTGLLVALLLEGGDDGELRPISRGSAPLGSGQSLGMTTITFGELHHQIASGRRLRLLLVAVDGVRTPFAPGRSPLRIALDPLPVLRLPLVVSSSG